MQFVSSGKWKELDINGDVAYKKFSAETVCDSNLIIVIYHRMLLNTQSQSTSWHVNVDRKICLWMVFI